MQPWQRSTWVVIGAPATWGEKKSQEMTGSNERRKREIEQTHW
jgi:hypothetical protein